MSDKARLAAAVTLAVVLADTVTKWVVRETFHLGESVPVVGDVFRLTYILNPGAAFGLRAGDHSRLVFGVLAAIATLVLVTVIRRTPAVDRVRVVSLSLILGGAVGNLVDRIRHPYGVVDFLDVGLGAFRWPVFNLADIGVTTGALLLVLFLWDEPGTEPVAAERDPTDPGPPVP